MERERNLRDNRGMLDIPHTLYGYQERDLNEVIEKFLEHEKLLLQASTGYGKTYTFATFAKWYNLRYGKKVLIMCHRIELVEQASEALSTIGVTVEKIIPTVTYLHHESSVYVAMEKTLFNRLNNNPYLLKNVGLVISDEAHFKNFNKLYPLFPDAKKLGVTATPIINERETFFKCDRCNTEYSENTTCHGVETIEWGRPKAMSSIFDNIVIGASISELIEFGQLVPEINIVEDYANISDLEIGSDGDFSKTSLDKAYNNSNVVMNVAMNYEKYCKGKRTIIFNANAASNKAIAEDLKEKGYNVKAFDSVNASDVSRKQLVKWFNSTPDAILCNVGIFTTGFDSKEVQCIILNRATTSLSLYLQMVGRGGRASQKIYKPNFIVIDGGGNLDRFGKWSDNTRDWEKIFWHGIGKTKAKKETILDVKECENCGALIPRSEIECGFCGHIPVKKEKVTVVSDSVATVIDNIPYPNGEKIYEYTKLKGKDIHFAHKILMNQIIDLFILHQVSSATFVNTKNNGTLQARISKIVRDSYFVLMRKEDIQSGSKRTLNYVIQKTIKKLEKHYGE